MARPRTVEADIVQTFHCSYTLHAAIERVAETSHSGNVSIFIRGALEEACRAALGPDKWDRLQSASDKGFRKKLLEEYLQTVELTRTRRAIDSEVGGTTRDGRARIFSALESYGEEFEGHKRRPDVDPALGVALDEAADTIRKISLILRRSQITQGSVRFMQRAASKFPDSLRAELDAAIINRVAGLSSPVG